MKLIISESQVKHLIKKFFQKDFSEKIGRIRHWDDLPSSLRNIFGEERIFYLYLRDFGPMYIILDDGKEYIAQYRIDNWTVTDERDRQMSGDKFMDKIGIGPLGLSMGEFINTYIEE